MKSLYRQPHLNNMDFIFENTFQDELKEKLEDFYERWLFGDNETVLFLTILGVLWIMFTFEFYLNYRQRKVLRKLVNPSPEILTIMSRESYLQSRSYSLDRNSFNMLYSWYSMLQITFILKNDTLSWLWTLIPKSSTMQTIEKSGFLIEEDLSEDEMTSLLFILYIVIFSFIDGLPWTIYKHFYIERKYGFNKKSTGSFLINQIKIFVSTLSSSLVLNYLLISIIKIGGSLCYVYVWALCFLMIAFFVFLYPEFISPKLENFIPMAECSLKRNIELLAKKLNFPLSEVLIVHRSSRTSHSRLYFYGLWNRKCIVLFDTLLHKFGFPLIEGKEQFSMTTDSSVKSSNVFSEQEILAILSHEFGHWQLKHSVNSFIIGQINLFFVFFGFGYVFNCGSFYKSFGFKDIGTPNVIKLVLIFQILFSPYSAVLEFIITLLSRSNEFQADRFSVKLGYGTNLIDALIKLHNLDLSFPIHDKWYSKFLLSHPPLLERIRALKKIC